MHVVVRERHGLDEAGAAEDLGQAPADLVVLSFSDSDLGAFAAGWRSARDHLPTVRLANLRRLAHPLSVDLYLEKTLSGAKAVLIRLLGGVDYWRYGLDEVQALAARTGLAVAVIPGDGYDDPRLDQASNLPISTLRRLKHLTDQGGAANARAALAQLALAAGLSAPLIRGAGDVPRLGFYRPEAGPVCPLGHAIFTVNDRPRAVVVFYRSFLTAADTHPVDQLITALEAAGFDAIGLFVPSLKDADTAPWVARWLSRLTPDVIINATAFSARGDGADASPLDAAEAPVLQVALAGSTRAAWAGAERGLAPADLAMHVVLPEIDGRLFSGVVSFKEPEPVDPDLGFARLSHKGDSERIGRVVARAKALARLRRTPRADRRLALILSTYPGRADQIAHAVGLDAPASTVSALESLAAAGFGVSACPSDGATLLRRLTADSLDVPLASYQAWLATLPPSLQAEITTRWGAPQSDPDCVEGMFRFPATRCGHVLVALQPERGDPRERARDYHDARRPPRHAYVAFYLALQAQETIDALIHMGAHGTLEWLPGKSVAVSSACWPDALIGALPVVYPFVVNDPGEAAAAKRRLGALTIGHMTPPLVPSSLGERLKPIERLLDEYSTADGLDPRRRDRLAAAIIDTARDLHLDRDAGLDDTIDRDEALVRLDAFVCDIKDSLYPDGLHVFGQVPALLDPTARAAPFDACAEAERAALIAALDGRRVAPGPAGSPWRGRADVMPTGRNLYSVDPRAVPSRAAHAQGVKLAEALVVRHLQDHGEYPKSVFVDLWGSATMRTAGEEFALALHLLGVAPTWDHGSDRVNGFEVIPLMTLGRPRVEATLRISGLFRDVFPALPALYDQAVAAVAARDEPDEDNPLAAQARRAPGDTPKIDPHVFGPAPGSYGAGVVAALTDFSEASRQAAGEAWLAASAHAYGVGETTLARAALEARTASADAFIHVQDLPETDLLMAPDYASHEAGFAAAARNLTGKAPALYHADTTRADRPRVRDLKEEVARVVHARASHPGWIAGQMRHGFRGAAEMAWTLDQMAAFAHLAEAVGSHQFDRYFDATLGDDQVRAFLAEANPDALAHMTATFRALAAAGLWSSRRNSVAALLDTADPLAEAAQ